LEKNKTERVEKDKKEIKDKIEEKKQGHSLMSPIDSSQLTVPTPSIDLFKNKDSLKVHVRKRYRGDNNKESQTVKENKNEMVLKRLTSSVLTHSIPDESPISKSKENKVPNTYGFQKVDKVIQSPILLNPLNTKKRKRETPCKTSFNVENFDILSSREDLNDSEEKPTKKEKVK